jgi:hypothetical protein
MHQVIMKWHVGVDPERSGHRGTSGRPHRTCLITKVGLWTLTGVDRTLAVLALGRIEVRSVSVLLKLGRK